MNERDIIDYNVWTYWEGEKPFWIDVCIASLKHCCGSSLKVLNHGDAEQYLQDANVSPAVFERFNAFTNPAHRADILRAAILSVHGGYWIDADTVCFKDVRQVHRTYGSHDLIYMTWANKPRRVINGYVFCQKDSTLAHHWLDGIQLYLERGGAVDESTGNWGALGEKILTPLVDRPLSFAREIPLSTFLPLDVDLSVNRLFTPARVEEFVRPGTVAFGLNHSWMMARRREIMEMPESSWQYSDLLIHRLLERAKHAVSHSKP